MSLIKFSRILALIGLWIAGGTALYIIFIIVKHPLHSLLAIPFILVQIFFTYYLKITRKNHSYTEKVSEKT